jgi:hypothetical protein
MAAILLHVLLTIAGAGLAAGAIAGLSWTLLIWTRFPGIGPIIAFAGLAATLHRNDFTQMLLLFSGLIAAVAFFTLAPPAPEPGALPEPTNPGARPL